jgi:hypothetical protein
VGGLGTERALRVYEAFEGGISSMSAIPRVAKSVESAPATTLAQLISVLSELTDDENEIVATMLHMVEQGSVRLITA